MYHEVFGEFQGRAHAVVLVVQGGYQDRGLIRFAGEHPDGFRSGLPSLQHFCRARGKPDIPFRVAGLSAADDDIAVSRVNGLLKTYIRPLERYSFTRP
jgi:hypothetical protein